MGKKRLYFENLDGLRFLCFLSVFLYHSFHTELEWMKATPIHHFIKRDIFGNGNLGVNFFFVLSGFLITYLLIEEKRLNQRISLPRFWLRRVLRIWPLFYFCVAFGFLVFPALKQLFGGVADETATPWYYLLFLNNFDVIRHGMPDSSVLGVLWSVAVEEQFYLLWPIILGFTPIPRMWLPFLGVIAASLVFRATHDDPVLHEQHTLSCIGDMTVGALGAWLVQVSAGFKQRMVSMGRLHIAGIYALFVLAFLFRDEVLFSNATARVFERLFIAVLILFIILEQTYAHRSFFKMSRFKRITRLGVITYGLYCLHFIGILITLTLTRKLGWNQALWQVMVLETALSLAITIVLAKLSYRYFESPFLRLKERFSIIATGH